VRDPFVVSTSDKSLIAANGTDVLIVPSLAQSRGHVDAARVLLFTRRLRSVFKDRHWIPRVLNRTQDAPRRRFIGFARPQRDQYARAATCQGNVRCTMDGFDGFFGGAFGTAGSGSERNGRRRGDRDKRGRGSKRSHGGSDDDHRAHALAKQAWHAIDLELGALSRGVDWNIRVVHVDAVGGGPLTVFVTWDSSRAHAGEVLDWLGRIKGTLRSAVASSITRKRVPDLQFVPAMGFTAPSQESDIDMRGSDLRDDLDETPFQDFDAEGGVQP
jgi:hypothetical protein